MSSDPESRGLRPFNWYPVLTWAPLLTLYPGVYRRLVTLARNWHTAPTGQLWEGLPRDADGIPLDSRMAHMGYRFAAAIYDRQWAEAQELIRCIEFKATLMQENQKRKPTQSPVTA